MLAVYQTQIAMVLACTMCAGCVGDSDSAVVGRLLMQQITGESTEKIDRDAVAAIPYATMGLQWGAGPEALLVLGAATPQQLDWYAGEQAVIVTRKGRVVSTAGLPHNLGGTYPLPETAHGTAEGASQRKLLMDFPDLGIFGTPLSCTEIDRGPETIEILGGEIKTRHIVERCASDTLHWHFDNDYWRDAATDYVWRSRQNIHPKSPPMVLEVFRPEQNGPE